MAARPKLLNDPVYGFIQVRHADFTQVFDHPWVQRLRRISQLGLSHLVYPGPSTTGSTTPWGPCSSCRRRSTPARKRRGHHRGRIPRRLSGHPLHDVGHGPFSHALEHSLVRGVHQEVSTLIMTRLNEELNGMLDTAIEIFNDHHLKGFLHDLVSANWTWTAWTTSVGTAFSRGSARGASAQSASSGCSTCTTDASWSRKGIYSIEKFIISRRLMYWQVYLHKTVLAAEWMMMGILDRARELGAGRGHLDHAGRCALPPRRPRPRAVHGGPGGARQFLCAGRQRCDVLHQGVAAPPGLRSCRTCAIGSRTAGSSRSSCGMRRLTRTSPNASRPPVGTSG